MKKNKKQKGYTLLEVLVVVVILGILTYVSVPTYNRLINKSDVSDALHKIDMFSGAQGKYFIEKGAYTGSLGGLETPLKGNSDEILTTGFTYSAGDPHENNYCVYAESNKRNYVLGRNYKTNSEVLCSGADCGKISSFVKEGSLSELCGGNFHEECDLKCEAPKVLNEQKCACVCYINSKCNPNQVLDQDSCNCVCSPAAIAACSDPLKRLDQDCSCVCTLEKTCKIDEFFNQETCDCEKNCELSDETCKDENGTNFILSPKKCECICGLKKTDCQKERLVLNKEKCICEEPECELTDGICQEENNNENFVVDKQSCKCICGLTEEKCKSSGMVLNYAKCVCEKSDCELTDETCRDENNENYIADKQSCKCICGLNNKSCGEGFVLNEEKCICEEYKCKLTDEECQNVTGNENYIADTENCKCECGLKDKDCGEGHILNLEKCICEQEGCKLTDDICKKQNGEGYVLDTEKCDCICGISEVSCLLQGGIFNLEKCDCKKGCSLNPEKCKDQNHNFVFVEEDCECQCGLNEFQCKISGKIFDPQNCECVNSCEWSLEACQKEYNSNYWFNEQLCSCECGLSDWRCKQINEHWTVLPSCNCGCPEEATCTDPLTVWNSETCTCDPMPGGCTLTDEYCKRLNANFYLQMTQNGGCECACGLKESDCTSLGLEFVDYKCMCASTCTGNIDLNPYACAKYYHQAYDSNICQCVPSTCPCVSQPGGCTSQNDACNHAFGWTAGFFNYGTCECDAYGNYIN